MYENAWDTDVDRMSRLPLGFFAARGLGAKPAVKHLTCVFDEIKSYIKYQRIAQVCPQRERGVAGFPPNLFLWRTADLTAKVAGIRIWNTNVDHTSFITSQICLTG